MKEIKIFDKEAQRPVRRGEKGQRSTRPSSDKFLNNENFLLGKFKAKFGAEATSDGADVGGSWLGSQYMDSRGWKAFGVQEIIKGIMAH